MAYEIEKVSLGDLMELRAIVVGCLDAVDSIIGLCKEKGCVFTQRLEPSKMRASELSRIILAMGVQDYGARVRYRLRSEVTPDEMDRSIHRKDKDEKRGNDKPKGSTRKGG